MNKKVFINGKIISNGTIYDGYNLFIVGNRIEAINKEKFDASSYQVINLLGRYISPGFVDLQIMGAAGVLYGSNPTAEGLYTMEQVLLKEGVCVFLPTVSTNSMEVLQQSIRIAKHYRQNTLGNFLGLHIEGPYINEKYRGAHPQEFIRKPTVSDIQEMLQENQSVVKMMTIAPEQFDLQTLEYLEEQEIVLSIGHTGATYDDTIDFLERGKKSVTHLFNGMPPIHHRNPGPIPAIFAKKPYTSIVADGIHVDFRMIAFAKQNLDESLYLISDAATNSTTGIYQHNDAGDRFVTLNPADNSTVLSGSKLTMLKAIKNCVEEVGIPLAEAVNMATLYPSKLIGIEQDYGSISNGKLANFVVFDINYTIMQVYFNGHKVFV
jgi:N-acetylglucosamine-6-phosphate deacetylase